MGGQSFVSSDTLLCSRKKPYCHQPNRDNLINQCDSFEYEFNKNNKILTETDKHVYTFSTGRTSTSDSTYTFNCKVGKLP